MDLVNSVTQNSNNRNVKMENQAGGFGNGNDDNDDCNNNNNNNNNNNGNNGRSRPEPNQHMQSAPEATDNEQLATPAVASPSALPAGPASAKSQMPDYLKAIGMDPRKFWPKKYRFTRENSPGTYNPMTIAQRNFYESNGYIVIDDCASPKLLQSIGGQHKEQAYVNEFLIEKLVAKNSKLLPFVKCFCDERSMLMTHQLVETFQTNELARAVMDNEQVARQQLFRDWIYLPFRPIDKVVCAIIAIEPVEHVLLVVPGTHRVGQCSISSTLETISAAYETSHERTSSREIFECSPERLSSLVEKSKKGFKYVNLKPGQTLFYHPGLIHGFSDDLVNFKKRQLATIAYYAAADCEYVDLSKTSKLISEPSPLPISLAHFNEKNPSDYSSWIGKPRLLQDAKASL